MKFLFTILAIAAVSTTTFAQTHDLSISFDAYTDNQVVTGTVESTNFSTDPIDASFTITNNGPDLVAGDTIVFGFLIGGNLYAIDLTLGRFNFTDTTLAMGETLNVAPLAFNLAFPAGSVAGAEATICAFVTLQDAAVFAAQTSADATFNGDGNVADNLACVTYRSTGTLTSLAENLKTIVNKTFIANNQLVIENNSGDFNSAAIINVINISGQVVATENRVIQGGRNTIELNNLSPGIYLVSFQVEDEISTTKVMVK